MFGGTKDMRYNEIIRQLREYNEYTQQYIADLLNVGQRTYCDYESGKTRMPIESLTILAQFYNVSMDYICGLTVEKGCFPLFCV